MKTVGKVLFPALGMLVMILDAKTALASAEAAVRLCMRVVVPALFPFLVLSSYLNGALRGARLPFGDWIARFTGIPAGSEGILLTGILGGYPSGAKAVADGVRSGVLTPWEGERMLSFCNNAGPAFLFGMVASLFPKLWMAWALWGIHIASALLVGHLLPEKSQRRVAFTEMSPFSFPAAVSSGVKTMAVVCGWVVLFRILIGFLDRWVLWALPGVGKILVAGLLELTNGCWMIRDVNSVAVRFVLCSGLLAFGGVCVMMQTASVADGISTKGYFPGKCLQSLLSISVAVLLLGRQLPGWSLCVPLLGIVFVIFLEFRQKRGSIPRPIHV